jgi:hypothetical protein
VIIPHGLLTNHQGKNGQDALKELRAYQRFHVSTGETGDAVPAFPVDELRE